MVGGNLVLQRRVIGRQIAGKGQTNRRAEAHIENELINEENN